MKKILLFVAMAFAITASAQKYSKPTSIHRFPVKAFAQPKQKQSNPRKAAGTIGDNQMIFGHSGLEAQFYMQLPLGVGEHELCVGFMNEQLKKYKGCKIVGIRFALYQTSSISSSSIWLSDDPSMENNYIQTTNVNGLVDLWNIQDFTTPYTITGEEEELYAGITYTSMDNSAYNVLTVQGNDPLSFYLKEEGRWYDYAGLGYGELPIQLILEGNLPERDLKLDQFSTDRRYYQSENYTLYIYTLVSNMGIKKLNGFTIDGYIDGEKQFSLKAEDEIGNEGMELRYDIPIKDYQLSVGMHELMLCVADEGGLAPIKENAIDDTVRTMFNVYSGANTMKRDKFILEYVTCNQVYTDSLASTIINNVAALRNDIIPVAIHVDYSESYPDELSIEEGLYYAYYLANLDAPSVIFNRYWVPGADQLSFSMDGITSSNMVSAYCDYVSESIPAFCSVNITPTYDGFFNKLILSVTGMRTGDFRTLFGDGALTVLLTEDHVNAYQAGYSADNYSFEHNGVLRKVVSSMWGDNLTWNGLRFTKNYTVDIEDYWNLDNMKAVAFITRPIEDYMVMDLMDINNANAVSLKDINTDAIVNVVTDNVDNGKIYDLSGRVVKCQPNAGIYIQNGKKIVVK